ncbi:hypothetical protein B0H10DRAFT_2207067 [Mycena sp. CBHHK59/15]|nr:hypothetical protein B0H10DRAFT_2207067 [Mycena sp. CBHHK59/15]
MNLNIPSALAWRRHLETPLAFPTPATTPVWPQEPHLPLSLNVVSLPADTLHWTPGTFPPLPFGTPVPLHIHPSLIPNPINPTIPQLQWDVLHAPEQARLYTGRGIIKKPSLKDVAVFPAANRIWICAEDECQPLAYWMQIWGPIIVDKTSSAKIIDVLDAVRAYFMTPLTREDFRIIRESRSPLNPEPLRPLARMARKRAGDAYELFDISMDHFKRIDVLGTYRRWGGVRPAMFQDGTWELFMNLLPGPVPRVA